MSGCYKIEWDDRYEQVKEQWMEKDPLFEDTQGWQDFLNQQLEQFFYEQEKKEKELLEKHWLKQLGDLTPRGSGVKLDQLIYQKILVEAQDYTEERQDEFKENMELMQNILLAQAKFEKEHNVYAEMFWPYIVEYENTNDRLGQFATPKNVAKMMTEMTIGEEAMKGEPKQILDPCCGTGTFMVCCAEHYQEKIGHHNYIFWNIDIDKRMTTYTTMNAILRRIPAVTIWGNALSCEYWEAWTTIPVFGAFQWKKVPEENLKILQETHLKSFAE